MFIRQLVVRSAALAAPKKMHDRSSLSISVQLRINAGAYDPVHEVAAATDMGPGRRPFPLGAGGALSGAAAVCPSASGAADHPRSDGCSWFPTGDGSLGARASVAPLPCSGRDDACSHNVHVPSNACSKVRTSSW